LKSRKSFILSTTIFLVIHCQGQSNKDSLPAKSPAQDTTIYTYPEIEPAYPGGPGAWSRYLEKNLHDPGKSNHKIGVTVQFIVDKLGNTSDIRVLELDNPEPIPESSLGVYKQEALRLIGKSGRWAPAIQNGRQARAYKRVTIEF
jgi:periplasmic protein TonB